MERKLILNLLFLLVGVGTLLACQSVSLLFSENKPIIPPRSIATTNLQVQEVWRVPSLESFLMGDTPSLRLTPNQIVTINSPRGGISGKLVSYSTATGQLEWEIYYGDAASSLVVDQSHVYVASPGRRVQAYSLQTGKLNWSGMDLPNRKRYNLDVRDGILYNYQMTPGQPEEMVYLYETKTGEMLEEHTVLREVNHTSLVMWIDQFALYQTTDELLKVKRDTNEIVWRDPIENDPGYNGSKHFGIKQLPILSDNKLIIMSGRIDFTLYALDYTTGERLWTVKGPFTSNVAVSESRVYALRQDAKLVVLDEISGEEFGFIEFSPAETPDIPYWIGASQDQLFVYFSDSKELIALDFKLQ